MRILFVTLFLGGLLIARPALADEAIDALVEVLLHNEDPQLDADILQGVHEGLAATRNMAPPKHWATVEKRLRASPSETVKELARLLSLKFGSRASLDAYRIQAQDSGVSIEERRAALAALVSAKDDRLVPLAKSLLDDPQLRVDAIRALGQFNDPDIADELLRHYSGLQPMEARRAALNVLVSRPSHAAKLLDAVTAKKIPPQHLTADLVRQLRRLKDPTLIRRVTQLWGVVRDSPGDHRREIERYRKLIAAAPGDVDRGKPLFQLVCGQCHTLYGEGGKVGPDITGANRSDLNYLLHNILDPNAEIPNDYRTSNLELKDERSLTGIITRRDGRSLTLMTAAETLTLPLDEIASLRKSELSMMPEGLLQPLNEQQVRDLIAYLQH